MAAATLIRAATGAVIAILLGAVLRHVTDGAYRHALALLAVASAVPAAAVWYALDRTLLLTSAIVLRFEIPWRNWPRGLEVEYLLVMLIWSVGYFAFRLLASAQALERRFLEAALRARDADVRALGWQINPHFLFNTLNALRSLAAEDAGRARSMITQLASLLRYSLRAPHGGSAALSAELDAVRTFVGIHRARFERQIELTLEIDEQAYACAVPVFLLQPLVENAIEHGTSAHDGTRRVKIAAELTDGKLAVTVSNPGRLRPARGGRGVGLSNVSERVRAVYGASGGFDICEHDDAVHAIVTVPAVSDVRR
jgi:LytS/YehU family sensor histidine kinase